MTTTTLLSPSATTQAAVAVLADCLALLESISQQHFTARSSVIAGSSIGQHVRHSLDHFSAAAGALGGDIIDYDHRARNTPVENDLNAARQEIVRLMRAIGSIAPDESERSVRVRVMLSGSGEEAELPSTLCRELAFASHHAVHHHAMIAAIAREMRLPVPETFGKAPSTVNFERAR